MNRVVITGLGAVCAIGKNKEEYWKNLIEGKCGINKIALFDTKEHRTQTGAQVKDFHPEKYISSKKLKRMSRTDRMGIIAAQEAIGDSEIDLEKESKEKIGVLLGAGAGGMFEAEEYHRALLTKEPKKARPSLLISHPPCVTTDYIAKEFGLRGPRSTIVTACSSSATSIGYAADLVKDGKATIMITGGSDALCQLTYSGFNSMRVVDKDRCRPFDKNRTGLSLGESAGILILEELEHAKNRGAKIYCEFLGYGLSGDAYHMTTPHPKGKGAIRAIREALRDAGVKPEDVNYINAHGTATPFNDETETRAIKEVFKERAYQIPVSSTKSMVGHCLGAAGGIEAVAVSLAIRNDMIPPTANYENKDPQCDLDYVPNKARRKEIRVALSNSFAFGGNNTVLVFGKYEK
ncbi:beta-ketoacyl-ACP synthase II [bacterium]|nr:beta-ketoacyl-ACP synthase II [bacterium]MBU4561685.1 beta-ketoacyl-ACP synthase II [bacterium]MCG2676228.1 beta-ketoacyl-ACP synthase II [bacterium]MCG2677745.1 beta-ketoacyl-ACP synthase II [bacterium]